MAKGLEPRAPERLELQAVYYDTGDLRLARGGVTLRHRSDEGWTLKLSMPDGEDSGVLVRRAYCAPGPPDAPPDSLLARARAWLRHEMPTPIARLRTERERVRLVDAAGAAVAEVVSDTVTASLLLGSTNIRFREVKAELRSPAAEVELLERLGARLQAAGAAPAPPIPKLARALALPVGSGELRLEPHDASAAEAVRSAIARSAHRFLLHDPGLVSDEDPEDVHRARVALRRLRSDLRTFAPLLDPESTARLREEAGWFAKLLGGVRDADVMAARLRHTASSLPSVDQGPLESLLASQEAERGEARDALLAGRDQERFLDLADALVAAAATVPDRAAAAEPAREVLPGLVGRRWQRARRARARVSRDPTDAELHRLRIEVKRLRYAAEAAASVADGGGRRLAHTAAALQDVLGEHQDAVVLEGWLRSHAVGAAPAVALVAGELVVSERERATRMREQWPAAWRRLARQGAAWKRSGH